MHIHALLFFLVQWQRCTKEIGYSINIHKLEIVMREQAKENSRAHAKVSRKYVFFFFLQRSLRTVEHSFYLKGIHITS